MSGQYMDFVPAGGGKTQRTVVSTAGRTQRVVTSAAGETRRTVASVITTRREVKTQKGVSKSVTGVAKEIKSQKISRMPVLGRVATKENKAPKHPAIVNDKAKVMNKKIDKSKVASTKDDKKTLKLSKVAFLNTDKVLKRPLSKNIYQKKIVPPAEVPSAPVTIIDKPEKDSRVGLVVTIVVTIVLGAAAGTVAFLLLPK